MYNYMAALALPSIYEAVERDLTSLEQRREYLEGLVAQQQNEIANLERTFQTPPVDSAALQAMLERLDALGVEKEKILGSQAGQMSAADRRAFKDEVINDRFGVANRLRDFDGTRAQFETRVQLYEEALREQGGRIAAGAASAAQSIRNAREGAAESGQRPFAAVGAGGADEAITETQEAIRALRQRTPEGIRGGDAGELEIARRANAAAPEGTGFATEEDAFQAALTALADGVMDLEDFGGNQAALDLAQQVYNKAREVGAYENRLQANFESTMLAARQRLAQLEAQSESLARQAGLTREQELARMQLTRLGYDLDKPYVRLQKSRYYPNLIRGDELFNAALEASARLAAEDPDRFTTPQGMGSVVIPTNKPQTLARDYVAQRWNAGDRTIDFTQMEREFGKVLRGDDLQEAMSFAYAFHKGLKRNIANPTDAERQMEAQRQAEREREQRRQDYLDAERARAQAAELNARMEAEQQGQVRGMREEVGAAPEATQRLVQRFNIQGYQGNAVRERLNEGFNILTAEGISEETRDQMFAAADFNDIDRAQLAIAFSPQLRSMVRQASDERLAEMASNPLFQQDAERELAQRRDRARLTGIVAPEGQPTPRQAERVEEELRRQRQFGVIEPGEVQQTDILMEPDFMLERQRRTVEEPPPQIPAGQRSRNIPPMTPQQKAALEALDDDTLNILAQTGSWYAGQILASRGGQAPAQSVAPAPEPTPEPEPEPEPAPRQQRQPPAQNQQQPPAQTQRQPPATQTGIPFIDQPPSEEERQQITGFLQSMEQDGAPSTPALSTEAQNILRVRDEGGDVVQALERYDRATQQRINQELRAAGEL